MATASEPKVREILARLVGFETVSALPNRALIDYVADYLKGSGADVRVISEGDGGKANLFATIGPSGDGGICLSGHTDVVPVAGQNWTTDPFILTERDERFYGRGTADMKGFLATALALAPEMARRPLVRPIHFALSHDEEVGCLGAPAMIRELGRSLPRPAIVIVGEPTEMKPATAHKGVVDVTTTVTGLEAHSSLTDRGVNAIVHAMELISFLGGLADEYRAGPRSEDFDPPHTTINVSMIEGGTAINIIPRQCVIRWEFRPLPGVGVAQVIGRFTRFAEDVVLPKMRAIYAEADIKTRIEVVVPPLVPDPESPAEALVRRLTGVNRSSSAAFASEAGQFQEAGISAVLCGPGSVAQAHQPDEYVTRDQLAACETFLRRLIDYAET